MKKRILMVCMAAALMLGTPVVANQNITTVKAEEATPQNPTNKWEKEASGWRYYDGSGNPMANGQKSIGGKNYYFNANGYLVTGFGQVGGSIYYYSKSGSTPQAGLGVRDNSTGWKNWGGERSTLPVEKLQQVGRL